MQIAQQGTAADTAMGVDVAERSAARRSPYADYKIIRRNGAVVGFEPAKISVAMTKAYLAVAGSQGAASARIRELVADLTESVVSALVRRQPQGGTFHIEDIQDQVELALMRSGEHDVARAYVLYREERSRARAAEKGARDIVLAGTHQRELHLVLDVFDVEGAASRLPAHQGADHRLGQPADHLAHPRRGGALAAVDRDGEVGGARRWSRRPTSKRRSPPCRGRDRRRGKFHKERRRRAARMRRHQSWPNAPPAPAGDRKRPAAQSASP